MKEILANLITKRALFIPALIAIQAREGIETTEEQAAAAYDKVQAEKHQAIFDAPESDEVLILSS